MSALKGTEIGIPGRTCGEMYKKKILLIGPNPAYSQGGMASVIGNIINSNELNNCFNVRMYPSFIDGSRFKRIRYSLNQYVRFARSKQDYDVYHVHIASGTSTWRKRKYIKCLKGNASKVVVHIHGAGYHLFYGSCSERQKAKIRELFQSVGAVVVLSREWLDFFVSNEICDLNKTFILHNAVEAPIGNEVENSSKNVLFMGHLGERKSPDVLLRSAAIVVKRYPEAHFTFGGDGDIETYKNLATELGVENNCTFAGWVTGSERENLFRSHSIYCLPSKNEGMPMSVLEAMSYGLATVSTPVGGVPQVITDGVNGCLVPVDDHESLAGQLMALMGDQKLADRLGVAGRKTIMEEFSMESYTGQLANIYKEMMK